MGNKLHVTCWVVSLPSLILSDNARDFLASSAGHMVVALIHMVVALIGWRSVWCAT